MVGCSLEERPNSLTLVLHPLSNSRYRDILCLRILLFSLSIIASKKWRDKVQDAKHGKPWRILYQLPFSQITLFIFSSVKERPGHEFTTEETPSRYLYIVLYA